MVFKQEWNFYFKWEWLLLKKVLYGFGFLDNYKNIGI